MCTEFNRTIKLSLDSSGRAVNFLRKRRGEAGMTLFEIPKDITDYLAELDDFIEREIKPIEQRDDNIRFFDHRREHARTDWDNNGMPRHEWEDLLREMRQVADKAGHFRFNLPEEYGGKNGSHLAMACIREHLAAKGLGLHNDLQNESSIVGNLVQPLMVRDFGTEEQKRDYIPAMLRGEMRWTFGLTEEHHGSDATWMDTRAVPETRDGVDGWLINGNKMWTTGSHVATHCMVFARHSGADGSAQGIGCFLVPADSPGFEGIADKCLDSGPYGAGRPQFRSRLCAALRARKPHPPGSIIAWRGAILHQRKRQICEGEEALWQAARGQPGDPVSAGGTAYRGGNAPPADLRDERENGHDAQGGGREKTLRRDLDVQLSG
jgi:hypothetical protein